MDMGRAQIALPEPLTVVPTMYDPDLIRRMMPVGEWAQHGLISQAGAMEILGFDVADTEPDYSVVTVAMQQYGQWVKVSDLTRRVDPLEQMNVAGWMAKYIDQVVEPSMIRRLDPMTVYPSLTSSPARARGRG